MYCKKTNNSHPIAHRFSSAYSFFAPSVFCHSNIFLTTTLNSWNMKLQMLYKYWNSSKLKKKTRCLFSKQCIFLPLPDKISISKISIQLVLLGVAKYSHSSSNCEKAVTNCRTEKKFNESRRDKSHERDIANISGLSTRLIRVEEKLKIKQKKNFFPRKREFAETESSLIE